MVKYNTIVHTSGQCSWKCIVRDAFYTVCKLRVADNLIQVRATVFQDNIRARNSCELRISHLREHGLNHQT